LTLTEAHGTSGYVWTTYYVENMTKSLFSDIKSSFPLFQNQEQSDLLRVWQKLQLVHCFEEVVLRVWRHLGLPARASFICRLSTGLPPRGLCRSSRVLIHPMLRPHVCQVLAEEVTRLLHLALDHLRVGQVMHWSLIVKVLHHGYRSHQELSIGVKYIGHPKWSSEWSWEGGVCRL
jgi:hypothetical protein